MSELLYRRGMPTISRIAAPALVLACAAMLSGCDASEPEPPPTPSTSSSAEPVFASEEEALAAATEAYAAFQESVDSALAGDDPAVLSAVASGEALETAEQSVSDYRALGHSQVGRSELTSVRLVDPSSAVRSGEEFVQVYACLDVSEVDVIDSSGQSVIPADRATLFPLMATLEREPARGELLVSVEETWNGENFCA